MNFNDINFNLPNLDTMRHEELMKNIIPVGNLLEKQVQIQEEELKQIKNNYNKLDELYKLKSIESEKYEKEAKTSRKYNKIMGWIAGISLLVSIASLICSIVI